MKNFNLKAVLLSSGILTLMGCGPMKDFHEMHDSTMKMNATTSEMNTTTAKMAETTQLMAQNMTEMLKVASEMSSKMTDMSSKMTAVSSHMGEMSTGMKDMQTGMQTMSNQMNALPEMNANMKTLTGKMDVLAEMNQNMKNLRLDIGAMTTKMEVLKTMNDNMTALRGDMSGMSSKMDVLKTMSDSMSALRGDIAKMTSKMDLLTTMNDNMTALRGDMSGMAAKMDLLKTMNSSMNSLRGDIATMTAKMDVLGEMNTNMKDLRGDIGGMAKQMSSVNDNIVVMASQMSGLSGDIKKMGATLDLTHSDLRLIFTGQHRIETLKAMEASTDQSSKMGYAAEYMISQTYQAWNAKVDSPQTRLDLMGMATPDFFFKISNYIHDRDNTDPTKQDPQSQNLYAIAAALDYVNIIEMEGLKGSDLAPVSMLSMIEDGLRMKAEVNARKVRMTDLPLYQREVLNHEQDAIYLLRVRQNFLKGVAFTLASLHENGDTQAKSTSVMDVTKARVLKKSWDAKLDTKSVSQLELIATTLDAAAETERFLSGLAISPMNNKNISALLKKMDVSSLQKKASSPEIEHFNRALQEVIELDSLSN